MLTACRFAYNIYKRRLHRPAAWVASKHLKPAMPSPQMGHKRPLEVITPVDKKPRLEPLSPALRTEDAAQDADEMAIDTELTEPSGRTPKNTTKRAAKAAAKARKKLIDIEPYSRDDVYWREINDLLGKDVVEAAVQARKDLDAPFEFREVVDLVISEVSSNGEGLAVSPPGRPPWVIIVPFTLPGERVRARVYRHARMHSIADLVSVQEPYSTMRDMSAVKCKYFGSCAGCQYQMLAYDTQLDLKRNVVVKAYGMFSDLPSTSVPPILPTAPSPLQYGYRTKITPHFDAPERVRKRTKKTDRGEEPRVHIGFNQVGKREVMDIEECPIATPILNERLVPLRDNIQKNIDTYKKGVSLLLRDSLEIPEKAPTKSASATSGVHTIALASGAEKHVCVTDHRETVRERVGSMLFEYPGGQFFQNNNSVLVPLVDYVKDALFPPPATNASLGETASAPTHLVDAYCGSGFFSIMLSPKFERVVGIELSADAIRFATSNAVLNALPEGRCAFLAGDAAEIFATVQAFPRASTALLIDPPRKGCDEAFVAQLLAFRAAVVVYVSCNVHTQARDVGSIVRGSAEDGGTGRYVLESVRGFDLFPQTAHVESVAVLRLI